MDAEFHAPDVSELRRVLVRRGSAALSELVTEGWKGVQPTGYGEDGAFRILKSKDVYYPEIDLAECDMGNVSEAAGLLRGGEVVLNLTGDGTLGRAAVIPRQGRDEPPLIPAVDVYAMRVDRSKVLPQYVALFLNSSIGRRITSTLQTGSSGQQHIYPQQLAMVPIPVPRDELGRPDLAWQREVVALAEQRVRALASARRGGQELDREFTEAIGVPVDLTLVPR
jgi:hypothetical protein